MTGNYWKKICAIPAYMFLLSPSGTRVQKMEGGNWIDKHEAQKVVDAAEDELSELRAERDQVKSENDQLISVIEDLDRARVSGFENYDFTKLKDRRGAEKVFEITIETECGCDIEEGEYTVRVTHLLGNWMGSDDFSLIEEAVAEVVTDLELPEEGHTTFIAYESGERQDVFWTKWFEIATVASVLIAPDEAAKEPSNG